MADEKHEPLETVFPDANSRDAAFDVDVYHTNFTQIHPQELRIIGRVVSFTCDTVSQGRQHVYVFKGWVAHITKNTVTLIDAIRYESQEELTRVQADSQVERALFPLVLHRVPYGPSAVTTGDTPAEGSGPSSDEAAAGVNSVPTTGNFGVIPYATFFRRKIRNVKFETDVAIRAEGRSESQFLSLSGDSQWYHHDMQKLRMFVRRYIVHTSQGNNAQKLSLVQFLQSRLGCLEMDKAVLQQVVKEELDDLQTVDEDISNRSREQQQQQLQRDAARREMNGSTLNPAVIASRQSALASTGIPTRTSYIAILNFALGIAILLYSASLFTTAAPLELKFIKSLLTYTAIAGAVLLVSAVATGVHAIRMTVPLNKKSMFMRVIVSIVAGGLAANAIYTTYSAYFTLTNADSDTLYAVFLQAAAMRPPKDLCDFFSSNRCSGFTQVCTATGPECPGCDTNGPVLCKTPFEQKVKNATVPLFIMSIAAGAFIFIDLFLVVRLQRVVRRLFGR